MATREIVKMLSNAIAEVNTAGNRMIDSMWPDVPLPRHREFRIGHNGCVRCVWPSVSTGCVRYDAFDIDSKMCELIYTDDVVSLLLRVSDSPAGVIRAVRQMERIVAWCDGRLEGRRRASEHILQQQQRYVEELEARLSMRALVGKAGSVYALSGKQRYASLVEDAVLELNDAVAAMMRSCGRRRPPVFNLGPHAYWPCVRSGTVDYEVVVINRCGTRLPHTSVVVDELVMYARTPAELVHTLRGIEKAVEWCRMNAVI